MTPFTPNSSAEALVAALFVVTALTVLLWLVATMTSFPVVRAGERTRHLPGIRSGDRVLYDDPLPPWGHPWERLRQYAWRLRMRAAGFKVFVVQGSPEPIWSSWPARTSRQAILVCMRKDVDCAICCGCGPHRNPFRRFLQRICRE